MNTDLNSPTKGYGFIYVLSNPTMPSLIKVGLTRRVYKRKPSSKCISHTIVSCSR